MEFEAGGALPVGEVAKLAGVTVRTLHHYDRIGLLVPRGRSAAGYRQYEYPDLVRLQHILAYRELGLRLDQIARLLAAKDPGDGQVVHILRQQHQAVLARIERLRQVAAVLERTMEAQKMGINLTPGEMLEVFGDQNPAQYADEVQERWGGTDAYTQSQRRAASYTKEDWIRVKAEQEAVGARLAELFTAGAAADSPEAMDAAQAHRQQITSAFYDCSPEIHMGLADMYLADPRFTKHYEDRAPGLAQWVHDAIYANALK
jgi:MerR family transcriptional regulator, thiopeptide resistance regulator